MYTLWKYFHPDYPTPPPKVNITFGRWDRQLDYLDYRYENLATRLIQFAKEAGEDPYGRYFAFEPLVDFAINKGIATKSADYIYRHYAYYLMGQHQAVDVDREELGYLSREFLLVPERKRAYLQMHREP